MAKMTKSQMLAVLAEKAEVSKKQAGALIDALVELAYVEVKKSGVFAIAGLGKMVKVNRKARMGRNPATGESIKIPAKTVVKFRLAKAAKEAVL
jgi:DNA-binding protein HU-beta